MVCPTGNWRDDEGFEERTPWGKRCVGASWEQGESGARKEQGETKDLWSRCHVEVRQRERELREGAAGRQDKRGSEKLEQERALNRRE